MPDGISINDALVFLLGAVGLVWYYLCLFSVGLKPSGEQPSNFRQFETLSITTISVSLATFVGSLLGLKTAATQVIEDNSQALQAPPPVAVSIFKQFTSNLSVSDLQWACAGLYVLSLLLAIAFWARGRDKTDPAISNLGKSLLGLVGGALAIALKAR